MDECHHKIPRLDNSIRTSMHAPTIIEVKESVDIQEQGSPYSIDRESLDFLQQKCDLMKKELTEARVKVEELEMEMMVRLIAKVF